MTGLSKFDQHRALEEGLALGCLAIGIDAFTSNKQAVEMAFGGAWRSWAWICEFPDVVATQTRCEILHILGRSPTRFAPTMVEWQRGRECLPSIRDNRELKELALALEESCGVPLEGWIDLANAFVERLDTKYVRRSA